MAVTEITAAAEKTIRQRIVGSIFAAQSLFSAATILAFTLSSIIAVDLSGSDSSAGLPNTIGLIARAALAYPFGWLLDRAGRRLGLTIGYLVGVVGVLITALSIIYGSFAGFLISAIFLGGVRASAEQGRYIAAEIYPIGRQASVMGWIVSAGTIGAISGPLLVDPSTKMAEGLGLNPYAGPFLVAAVGLFIAAIVVFTLLRPDPRTLGRKVEQADSASELPISKPVMPTGSQRGQVALTQFLNRRHANRRPGFDPGNGPPGSLLVPDFIEAWRVAGHGLDDDWADGHGHADGHHPPPHELQPA